MANGGPFGNPLTTGIALNFEVDMTPYRQMMQDNLAFAKNQAAERKKGQKEFQDILKNITLDTSKIHERYKKVAMNEYASTINDVMAMQKAGNVGGVHERIGKYNSGMDSYVNATTDFNNYKKSKGDNTFRNDAAISAMDNVEGVSDEQLMQNYQNDVGYSNGLFNFTVIDRPDVVGYGNKVLQGVDKEYVRDAAGEIVSTETFGPKGTRLYETSIKNPENFIKETSAWLLGSAGGNRLLMDKYGMTADQLDEVDKDTGRQRLDLAAEDYIRNTFAPKLYGEKEKDPYKPSTDSKGFTFGNGGAKSKRYSIMATDRPIDLSKEIGGELIGYDISDIGSSQGVRKRPIKVSKGSYFAKGGDRFIKVSNAASGEGVNLQAEPAGIYMRKDKPASEGVWLKYRTSYAPSDSGSGVQTQTSGLSVPSVDELYSKTDAEVDFFVPINSISEANQFISSMGLPKSDYERLLSDLKKRFNQTTTQSSSEITNPFD